MKHIALLRGVNVGGKNKMLMTELAAMFENAGCSGVETVIQSGNVVFEAASPVIEALPLAIGAAIEERYGYRILVILRSGAQMARVVENNPLAGPGTPERQLHVYFLSEPPSAVSLSRLDRRRSPPDEFVVEGCEIYLRLPNGMGRTRLTNAYFDATLATICTARNWATVRRLAELAGS